MFIRTCLSSSSDVSFVANHGVYFSRLATILGRDAFLGCEHFAISIDELLSDKFNA